MGGVLGIIASGIGVAATARGPGKSGHGYMISYFLMGIIVTCLMCFLGGMSADWSHNTGEIFDTQENYEVCSEEWKNIVSKQLQKTTTTTERYRYSRKNNGDDWRSKYVRCDTNQPWSISHIYIWFDKNNHYKPHYRGPSTEQIWIAFGLHTTIGIFAFLYVASTVVSVALICYNWLKNGKWFSSGLSKKFFTRQSSEHFADGNTVYSVWCWGIQCCSLMAPRDVESKAVIPETAESTVGDMTPDAGYQAV